ncbi:unnamed protein product [Prunus brigantina]
MRQYEQYNKGYSTLQAYTSISSYVTMHDDIFRLAFEKRVNLVIMPFHKQWAIDGNISRYICHVTVIFIGGADDTEALAHGARMARHPSVDLIVARFLLFGEENSKDRKRDSDLLEEYQVANADNERFVVVEEVVRDGARLSVVIRSMVDCFDLMLVGRHHQDSPLLSGLGEWSEYTELGIVGDMLASPNFHCSISVVVLQQQRIGGKPLRNSSSCLGLLFPFQT